MTLTVLNVAYSLGVVGDAVGGAEQVLSALDRALVDAGLRSIVIACEGSRAHGVLRATPAPTPPFDDATRAAACVATARAIAAVLDDEPVDVVHLHGIDFHEYLPRSDVPTLATLHLPPAWYPLGALAPTRPNTFLHCVSESQRRACPPGVALLPTIPNGVAIPPHAPVLGAGNGVVALGRICPEKGFHIALAAARRAGVPMTLAGQVFPYATHIEHWERDIVPLLDDQRRFVGPVDATRRAELLAGARCVLIPSLAPETSSLVAMEALAAGTPVVAFANGALPEIIEHGVTGFLVRDEQEMAEAIDAVAALDPDACRAAAVARFSIEEMTRRYIECYTTLARGHGPEDRRGDMRGEAHQASRDGSGIVETRTRALAIVPMRQRAALELAVVTSDAELRALAPEWRSLAALASCTPFQYPEWLLPWWRHFGNGNATVAVFHRAGELVGIAPLYVRDDRSERVLSLIGTGNSDYVDIVAHELWRGEVARAIAAFIADAHSAWDRCELGPLPVSSALLDAAVPGGWAAQREAGDVCPVLALHSGARGVDASVPPGFLARLRYAARRLAREHDVSVEPADLASARSAFEILCALHGVRWRSRGTAGVLADQRGFHEDVVMEMAQQEMLRLYVMRVEGHPAAAFYGFADARRLYYYVGGFDPGYRKHSVGSLVILHAIDEAARAGAHEVDFLRGAEPYKYRWGATDRRVHWWRLAPAAAAADAA